MEGMLCDEVTVFISNMAVELLINMVLVLEGECVCIFRHTPYNS